MMRATALLAAACAAVGAFTVPLPTHILHPPRSTHARGYARSVSSQSRWRTAAPPSNSSRTFNPADYGGDPTGSVDSTAAVAAAVDALLASARASGVRAKGWQYDAGGAALDLAGGAFIISSPLVFPAGYANWRLTGGTLRASARFPADRFLVEVANTTADGGGADIGIDSLFLDAYQVAAGCVLTNGVQGAVLGPRIYAFNFTQFGIRVNKGFEVTITESWAAEYSWADPRKENGTASVATGIYKDGNDGAITDVIVYSSRVGIEIGGEANILENLHTWSLANGNGGIGILVTVAQTRLVSCYLDWQDVVFTLPQGVSFIGGFFLCGARIRLVAPADGAASNVYIADNVLISSYCHFSGYSAVQADGVFSSAEEVTVVGTLAEAQIGVRSTAATAVVASATPTQRFTANFTDSLLFDVRDVPIRSVSYSVQLDDGVALVAHASRPPVGGVVTVELAAPVTGSVTVTVDQSRRRTGA